MPHTIITFIRNETAYPMHHESCYAGIFQTGDLVHTVIQVGKVHARDVCPECGVMVVMAPGKIEQLELWAS